MSDETIIWNPGEPLFDQVTCDFVEVDGDVVFPEDNATAIANAAWMRTMTQRGDCPRDRFAGIDRGTELFNPELPVSVGLGAVRQEIVDTPGIASVQSVDILGFNGETRELYLAFTADTINGDSFQGTTNIKG